MYIYISVQLTTKYLYMGVYFLCLFFYSLFKVALFTFCMMLKYKYKGYEKYSPVTKPSTYNLSYLKNVVRQL